MYKYYGMSVLLILLLLIPMLSMAAVSAWQILPDKSSLTFTATQNDAPVTGEFKKFTGDINFDLNQLNASNIKIIVDINSISDPYNELSDTLEGADWFNVKLYPQAVFQSTSIVNTGNNAYQAKGTLTIRDKKLPATLNFVVEENKANEGRIKGSTTIQRTSFGVGQGQWTDTKTVKDEVTINFVVTAIKK